MQILKIISLLGQRSSDAGYFPSIACSGVTDLTSKANNTVFGRMGLVRTTES